MAKHETGMREDSKITTRASFFNRIVTEHIVYIIKTLGYPLAQGNSSFCLPRRSLKEEDLGLDLSAALKEEDLGLELLAAVLFSLGE